VSLRNRKLLLVVLVGVTSTALAQGRFNFNVGGGFGGATGDVGKFTNPSYNGVAGGGVNFGKHFGLKAEYMFYNLSFKDSVKRDQDLINPSGRLQSGTLNAFLQFPLQGKVGVYAIFGGGWYQRSVDASSEFLPSGTICQPAWQLWGIVCTNGHGGVVDPAQTLRSNSDGGGGYNFGGGFTYRLNKRFKVYAEGRYHHANTDNGHTSVFPVTFGLRW
jgi:hypothetical protein